VRGVIEGFYGPPFEFERRLGLVRFLGRAGLDTYVYAPKDDPFHRRRWRAPYPAEYMEHFRDLVAAGRDVGVRFLFALSPALSYDPESDDPVLLRQKLLQLFGAGVRDFGLLFDDIRDGRPGADPEVQSSVLIDIFSFLRRMDSDASLCFVPHYYAGTAESFQSATSTFDGIYSVPSPTAYAAYRSIPPEVRILWTGPGVFSDRISRRDASEFAQFAGRPVIVWDNFAANDAVLAGELFLSPYKGREAGLLDVVDGVLLNPMRQPEASKVAIWTASRFFDLGEAYDPEAALAEALEVASEGGGAEALALLADHFHSHPLIGEEEESPRFQRLTRDFFTTRSPESESVLEELLLRFSRNQRDLEESLGNRALLAELRDSARKLGLFGEAGLLGLKLLRQRAIGESAHTAPLREWLARAEAIPWLVGANSDLPGTLGEFLAGRRAREADVFGDFFARLLAEIEA